MKFRAMPSPKNDKSQPNIVSERTPWQPIIDRDVQSIAERFEIGDGDEFANTIHTWSCNYATLRRAFRDIPSAADQRDILRDLASQLVGTLKALSRLGPAMKTKLDLAYAVRDDQEVLDAIALTSTNQSYSKAGKLFPESYDVDDLIHDIEELQFIAEAVSKAIESHLALGGTSLPENRNLDVDTLVASIREFFRSRFPGDQLGRNFDPSGLQGPAGQTPMNRYCEFTVECCRIIDPKITLSKLQGSMSRVINREQ